MTQLVFKTAYLSNSFCVILISKQKNIEIKQTNKKNNMDQQYGNNNQQMKANVFKSESVPSKIRGGMCCC